jgi:hypothetical protein
VLAMMVDRGCLEPLIAKIRRQSNEDAARFREQRMPKFEEKAENRGDEMYQGGARPGKPYQETVRLMRRRAAPLLIKSLRRARVEPPINSVTTYILQLHRLSHLSHPILYLRYISLSKNLMEAMKLLKKLLVHMQQALHFHFARTPLIFRRHLNLSNSLIDLHPIVFKKLKASSQSLCGQDRLLCIQVEDMAA